MRASTRSLILMIFLVLALVCLGSSCKLGGPEALKSVSFNPNGGKGTMVSQTFTNGTTQKLATNTFTRDGYTFQGWNTAKNGEGTSYANNADFTYDSRDSRITLFAQWGDNGSYTIEFIDTITPYVAHVKQEIKIDSKVALNKVASMGFSHSNSFIAWTATIGDKEYSFTDGELINENLANLGETVKFYSHWFANLNYNPNGGTGTKPGRGFETLTPVELEPISGFTPPTNSNYTGQWCTAPCEEDGKVFTAGTETGELTTDTTLYALLRYTATSFTVNKDTVSAHRQQNTVTNPDELTGSRYVIVATGHVYSDSGFTTKITVDTEGPGKYRYASYGKVYSLEDSAKTFYKDETTDVIVIYNIPSGYWFNTLPSKKYIQMWGNPSEQYGVDKNIINLLVNPGGSGDFWTGSINDKNGKILYYQEILGPPYWREDSDGEYTRDRFQTALF